MQDTMPYSILGKTGIKVSRLCFGSLTLGPLQCNLPLVEAAEVLEEAFRNGVNFVDTAQYYRNYPALAAGLRKTDKDIVVCSKTYAHTAEGACSAVDEARAALNRDVIDIFLLHEQEGDDTLRGHRPALDELYRLKALGIVRAVGISTHHVAGVVSASRWGLDVVHPLYNLLGLGIADGKSKDMKAAIVRAREQGVGVFTMKALAGGHLFGRAEEALNFVLGSGIADSVAVGMKNIAEVQANIEFFTNGCFGEQAKQALSAQKRTLYIEEYCTGCGTCIARCSAGAIKLQGGKAVCDAGRCLLCGYCAVCPEFCIKII